MLQAIFLGLLVAAGVAAASAGHTPPPSPCLTNAATASMQQAAIAHALNADSTQLAAKGLPYKPAGGVILVTNDSVCALAVSAFNAPVSDSTKMVSQAYVFQLGTAATAYVVNAPATAPRVYEFYSSSWIRLLAMSGE